MSDRLLQPGLNGAFVADGFGAPPHAARTGAKLEGKRLAVKDVFDIAGLRTGAGNLAWREQQRVAIHTALSVRALLEEGAQWIGKTVTDELTYSLAGVNAHYGTPVNPADPARIPGGSSSGSAVAVAAGHADIALGTDCGGSVRLPASYCGVWGMRPTHGRIAADGCLKLAQSFDTVGWFAREVESLIDVFEVLAHSVVSAQAVTPVIRMPKELLECADDKVVTRFRQSMQSFDKIEPTSLDVDLDQWARAFRTLQAGEIAQRYGSWAREHATRFGADVGARFAASLSITHEDVSHAQRVRMAAQRAMSFALPPGTYWLTPTVPGIAPRVDESAQSVDHTRSRSQKMLCVAGLAGLPQVSMPWATFDDAPLGLSVIGARGDDEGVLRVARDIHAALQSIE